MSAVLELHPMFTQINISHVLIHVSKPLDILIFDNSFRSLHSCLQKMNTIFLKELRVFLKIAELPVVIYFIIIQ